MCAAAISFARIRRLYYGAADTSIALATGSIRVILNQLEENGQTTR